MSVIRLAVEKRSAPQPAVIVPERPAPVLQPDAEGLLTVPTARFGELRVPAADCFRMPEGMHGFGPYCRYLLLAPKDPEGLFYWWQAVEAPEVAFPCVDVLTKWPDYRILANEADVLRLGLAARTTLQVLVVVTVPPHNPRGITANLLGPLILDGATREAWQIICERSDHRVDTPLLAPAEPAKQRSAG